MRNSARTQTRSRVTPAANNPSTRGDDHPQAGPSLTPTSKETSQPERSNAPTQSILPGARRGDSGTKKMIPAVETMTATRGNQKSQWYERCCTMGPARTIHQAAPDAEDRGDQRNAVRDAFGQELVANDREGKREDGAAGALNDACHDHRSDRARGSGERGAEGEDDEHDDERAFLAEHIAETPGDRSHNRSAQEIRSQDPRGAGSRGMEVVLDRQKRGRDERLQQCVRDRGNREQCEGDVVMLALGVIIACSLSRDRPARN